MSERTKIKKAITKGVNEANHSVDVIMSDESLDRDKEIILASAFAKRLSVFEQQPVISDSHKIGSVEDALGKFENIQAVSGEGLFSTAKYFVNDEKNNTPNKSTVRWAWVLVKNGLGAYSVRFIAHGALVGADISESSGLTEKVLSQNPRAVFTDVELVETSQVLVPANPQALALKAAELEGGDDDITLSICKGVFDRGILDLPKKHFLINYNPIKTAEESDGFVLKIEFDEELEQYDKFLKSLKVTDVTAQELENNAKLGSEDLPYIFGVDSVDEIEDEELEIEIELEDEEELELTTETDNPDQEAVDALLDGADEVFRSFNEEQDAEVQEQLDEALKSIEQMLNPAEEPEDNIELSEEQIMSQYSQKIADILRYEH